jgi:hypothetical protein
LKCAEKEIPGAPPFEPESPYVIVCEGWQDASFVCALLKDLGITNCDVTYPRKSDGGNGKDAIAKVLTLLAGRASAIEGIAVIGDADVNLANSFAEVCNGFPQPFVAPTQCFTVADGKKHRTGVFLIPGDNKTGTLEHLFIEAITLANPTALNCVETYRNCTATTTNWTDNKIGKMRLAAYVAAHCEDDPCCSPAYMWTSKKQVFQISSPAFQELRDFLVTFTTPPPPYPNKHANKPM